MKTLLLILALWPDGHRDILSKRTMGSMDKCTASLSNAVQVFVDSYEGSLFDHHAENGNDFVMIAYCATRFSKSDPA